MKSLVRRPALLLVCCLLQMSAASSASAALRERSWEVGTYLTGAFFDTDSNVENTAGIGFRVGYFFQRNHTLEASFDDIFTEVEDDSDLNVNLLTFKVGYLYTFMPKSRVTPHIFLGAGFQYLNVYEDFCDGDDDWWDEDDWWDDCYDSILEETDPLAYAGFGMRAFFTESFHLRADFSGVAVFPDEENDEDEDVLVDQVLNIGVGWIFGGGR